MTNTAPALCETQTPAPLVGGFVWGTVKAPRVVVQAEALYGAYHENELPAPLDNREAYASLYQYPEGDYALYVARAGSPKGYVGPTACPRLVWDIDSADPNAALADVRKLILFLRGRYGDQGLGLYWSGKKGFHVTLPAPPHTPRPQVPGVVKQLCLGVAANAGVTVDQSIYDHQRIFRLPNTKHPKSGLYKRFFDLDEFDRLDVPRILKAAEQPAGYPVPGVTGECSQLVVDWAAAEAKATEATAIRKRGGATSRSEVPNSEKGGKPGAYPVVPRFVREFIGFEHLANPNRAVTLFKCAAVLAESATKYGWPAVIRGLLEDAALGSGLGANEVARQIETGIARGMTTAAEAP